MRPDTQLFSNFGSEVYSLSSLMGKDQYEFYGTLRGILSIDQDSLDGMLYMTRGRSDRPSRSVSPPTKEQVENLVEALEPIVESEGFIDYKDLSSGKPVKKNPTEVEYGDWADKLRLAAYTDRETLNWSDEDLLKMASNEGRARLLRYGLDPESIERFEDDFDVEILKQRRISDAIDDLIEKDSPNPENKS